MSRINFLNIPVDALTMQETVDRIELAIKNDDHINHVVINAAKVVMMHKDRALFNKVVTCDIINADGQSIVWASRFLGKNIPERVAGADLMQELVKLANKNKYKCYFFGARDEVVKRIVDIYSQEYGPEIIAGYRNGYYSEEESQSIAENIASRGSQILFVAIPSPRKENFLYEHREILNKVNFTMGVGGTFDVIAGFTKRAPVWIQNLGMEWFYRFLQEPGRMWKRYLYGNMRFIWLVIKGKFKQN